MEVVRCIRGLVPLAAIALLSTTGFTRPPALGAADPPWEPPPCRSVATPDAAPGSTAWYRMAPVLDGSGTLAGQRLTLGVVGGRSRHLDLAPESFATGPVGGRVLVGDDDGSRSRLRVVDVVRGCASTLARESDVIRSAVLAPDLRSAWEHRVDRVTRADRGVWQRSLTAGDAPVRRLPGLAADDRYGPTFMTDLRWASDGRMVVAACGEVACRTRILDPATGRVDVVADTGPVLGVAGGAVVAYAVCPGLPCPIVSLDPATGARSILVEAAGLAAVGGRLRSVLVFEQADGTLAGLDLRTRDVADLPADAGMLPAPTGSLAAFGLEASAGRVLVAKGGLAFGPDDVRRLDVDAALATQETQR